jgi:transposase
MTPLEARLTAENEAQRQEIRLLREKIDLLVRRIFGKSSESMDEGQLMLLLQGDDGAKKTRPPAQTPASWRLRLKSRRRRQNPKSPMRGRPTAFYSLPFL